MKKIGVLAIQGGVLEHLNSIRNLGHEAIEVRSSEELEGLDGIILPGGESTAIGKILRERGILNTLKEKIENGLSVWGTCAGMILLAKEIEGEEKGHLEVMNIKVRRNAYGAQLESFTTKEIIKEVGEDPIELVFIRAPFIVDVKSGVEVVHSVNGNIVAAKEKNMFATSFHPELTKSTEVHKYFIEKVCR